MSARAEMLKVLRKVSGQNVTLDAVTAAYAPVMKALLEKIRAADFDCAPAQWFMAVQERAAKILDEMKSDEKAPVR